MGVTLGVGILGAGPVTQAIHLPTLARLSDLFSVVSVMDVDQEIAAQVAGRVGAHSVTSMDAVLDDPDVDVVAVCSPHHFHATQVEAICAAGKAGILCEKPLATDRSGARRIAESVTASGTSMVVGAMHAYDLGWLAALDECGDSFPQVHTIRSTIVLPLNARFEDWATEVAHRPPPATSGPPDAETQASMMRGLVLGLFVHDLPLVQAIAPDLDKVDAARFIAPFGGVISRSGGARRADLVAFMRPVWQPDWRLDAYADRWSMSLRFTPSYVHAGSATLQIRSGDGMRILGPWPVNGYEAEWVELYAQVADGVPARYDVTRMVSDLSVATDIADAASALVLGGR